MILNTLRRLSPIACAAAVLLTTGCNLVPTGQPAVMTVTGFHGKVHGGQQPVSGATIQVYVANHTQNSAANVGLITGATQKTDANGNFNISGTYTCSPSDLLYIVATGGNPGVSGVHNNSALAMMTGFGLCSSITGSTNVTINELTTVASIWALSPFMNDITHIGTSPTNATGLTNAFATINKIVDTSTGNLSGPALPAGATLPISELNTLADILASCINTVDAAGQSAQCQSLFNPSTGAAGALTPTDTIMAAYDIATNPTGNTTTLNAMASPTSPFQPTLATAPAAYTVAINYVGGGLSNPKAIAIDASGNVWVPNAGNNSVSQFSNTGAAISGPAGYTAGSLNQPNAIAIDFSGNAWVVNAGNTTITKLASNGATGTPFAGNGLSNSKGVSIDGSGNVWVANSGNNTVSAFDANGNVIGNYGGAGITAPVGIAVNPQ